MTVTSCSLQFACTAASSPPEAALDADGSNDGRLSAMERPPDQASLGWCARTLTRTRAHESPWFFYFSVITSASQFAREKRRRDSSRGRQKFRRAAGQPIDDKADPLIGGRIE